jgi:hypothetical protein
MNEYIDNTAEMPKDNQIISIKYTKDGKERFTKGFFFMNGTRPTFCAYGSEIENVIAWKA